MRRRTTTWHDQKHFFQRNLIPTQENDPLRMHEEDVEKQSIVENFDPENYIFKNLSLH